MHAGGSLRGGREHNLALDLLSSAALRCWWAVGEVTDRRYVASVAAGLPVHSTSWTPWQEFFEAAGYDVVAPEWPGTPDTVLAARDSADTIADHGIDDVTDHYVSIIEKLSAPTILIGHSFGGMISNKILGLGHAAAAVAIDAAQIKGVLPLPLSHCTRRCRCSGIPPTCTGRSR